MHWFTIEWWKYLFAKPAKDTNLITAVLCRMIGHKGVVYYNPYGLEPDMHCKKCGDDLG